MRNSYAQLTGAQREYRRLTEKDRKNWQQQGGRVVAFNEMKQWYSTPQMIEKYEHSEQYHWCNGYGRTVRLTREQMKLVHEMELKGLDKDARYRKLYQEQLEMLSGLVTEAIEQARYAENYC